MVGPARRSSTPEARRQAVAKTNARAAKAAAEAAAAADHQSRETVLIQPPIPEAPLADTAMQSAPASMETTAAHDESRPVQESEEADGRSTSDKHGEPSASPHQEADSRSKKGRRKRRSVVVQLTPVQAQEAAVAGLLLTVDRWKKLAKDLYNAKKQRFDLSKLPDVYDCIKHDILACPAIRCAPTKTVRAIYGLSRSFANIVIPQEYGVSSLNKFDIGCSIAHHLLRKIFFDLTAVHASEPAMPPAQAAAHPSQSPRSSSSSYMQQPPRPSTASSSHTSGIIGGRHHSGPVSAHHHHSNPHRAWVAGHPLRLTGQTATAAEGSSIALVPASHSRSPSSSLAAVTPPFSVPPKVAASTPLPATAAAPAPTATDPPAPAPSPAFAPPLPRGTTSLHHPSAVARATSSPPTEISTAQAQTMLHASLVTEGQQQQQSQRATVTKANEAPGLGASASSSSSEVSSSLATNAAVASDAAPASDEAPSTAAATGAGTAATATVRSSTSPAVGFEAVMRLSPSRHPRATRLAVVAPPSSVHAILGSARSDAPTRTQQALEMVQMRTPAIGATLLNAPRSLLDNTRAPASADAPDDAPTRATSAAPAPDELQTVVRRRPPHPAASTASAAAAAAVAGAVLPSSLHSIAAARSSSSSSVAADGVARSAAQSVANNTYYGMLQPAGSHAAAVQPHAGQTHPEQLPADATGAHPPAGARQGGWTRRERLATLRPRSRSCTGLVEGIGEGLKLRLNVEDRRAVFFPLLGTADEDQEVVPRPEPSASLLVAAPQPAAHALPVPPRQPSPEDGSTAHIARPVADPGNSSTDASHGAGKSHQPPQPAMSARGHRRKTSNSSASSASSSSASSMPVRQDSSSASASMSHDAVMASQRLSSPVDASRSGSESAGPRRGSLAHSLPTVGADDEEDDTLGRTVPSSSSPAHDAMHSDAPTSRGTKASTGAPGSGTLPGGSLDDDAARGGFGDSLGAVGHSHGPVPFGGASLLSGGAADAARRAALSASSAAGTGAAAPPAPAPLPPLGGGPSASTSAQPAQDWLTSSRPPAHPEWSSAHHQYQHHDHYQHEQEGVEAAWRPNTLAPSASASPLRSSALRHRSRPLSHPDGPFLVERPETVARLERRLLQSREGGGKAGSAHSDDHNNDDDDGMSGDVKHNDDDVVSGQLEPVQGPPQRRVAPVHGLQATASAPVVREHGSVEGIASNAARHGATAAVRHASTDPALLPGSESTALDGSPTQGSGDGSGSIRRDNSGGLRRRLDEDGHAGDVSDAARSVPHGSRGGTSGSSRRRRRQGGRGIGGIARDFTETVHKLDSASMSGAGYVSVKTPQRHVRTRLYFTSESHVHALVNVLRCSLAADAGMPDVLSPQGRAMLGATPELDYCTHIVVRLYERLDVAPQHKDRHRAEILFSPGACVDPLTGASRTPVRSGQGAASRTTSALADDGEDGVGGAAVPLQYISPLPMVPLATDVSLPALESLLTGAITRCGDSPTQTEKNRKIKQKTPMDMADAQMLIAAASGALN